LRGEEVAAKKNPSAPSTKKAAKKGREPLDQRLIKGLAHPLRVRILAFMNDRPWSPRELSDELNEGLSQISYHVKVLKDFKLIELTHTEPRRGAVEHYYIAVQRVFIPGGMAKQIPKSGRRVMFGDVMKEIDKDIGSSLKSGRFDARDDYHVSWTPADLDDQGCKDAEELADSFVEDFLKIEAASAKRRAESEDGGEHIPTSAAVLVFGSERGEQKKAPSRKPVRKKKKNK
jgi:DNA-binding transcriptional ArsR family regulator